MGTASETAIDVPLHFARNFHEVRGRDGRDVAAFLGGAQLLGSSPTVIVSNQDATRLAGERGETRGVGACSAARELLRTRAMNLTLLALVVAAVLEISGDALIRAGLVGAKWHLVVAGGTVLVAYGLAVNVNRAIDFGRLMGVYIAIFFVVSQIVAFVAFGSRPSARSMLAGALIVAGGVLFQLGTD